MHSIFGRVKADWNEKKKKKKIEKKQNKYIKFYMKFIDSFTFTLISLLNLTDW